MMLKAIAESVINVRRRLRQMFFQARRGRFMG